MKITTKGLIDILPFEEAFKAQLHQQWDSMSTDQRNTIAQLLWDTYADIYEDRFDTNVDLALIEVANGLKTDMLNQQFGKKIKEQTEKEMREQVTQVTTVSNLAQARDELQRLLTKPQENN
jgi:hypothetical protein